MGKAKRPIETWLELNWSRLFGYAFSLARDKDAARDLLQQAALCALASKSPPSDPTSARSWLFKIVRNVWIDDFRRAQTRSKSDLPHAFESAEWNFDNRVIAEITVRQGLSRIDAPYREIIQLVDLWGFQYSEVATILNLPIGTVMSRLSRARLSLLEAIAESTVTPISPSRDQRQRL